MGTDKEQQKSPKDKKEIAMCKGCGAKININDDVCKICHIKDPNKK